MIRGAYRSRARDAHPDRTAGATADEMARINEAYRVLSDAARRVDYDRALRARATSAGPAAGAGTGSAAGTASGAPSTARVRSAGGRSIYTDTLPPARVPWRTLAVFGGAAIALVLTLSVLSSPAEPRPPDGVIRSGSCVEVGPAGDAVEVRCEGDGTDVVVETLVPTDQRCPGGTVGYRDRLGLGLACVRSGPGS